MSVFQPQGHWARCARELSGVAQGTRNCRPFPTRLSSRHRVEWRGFADVLRGLRATPAAACSTPRTRSKAADASVWAGLWLRLDSEEEARHLLIMTIRDSTAGNRQTRESHNARSGAAAQRKTPRAKCAAVRAPRSGPMPPARIGSILTAAPPHAKLDGHHQIGPHPHSIAWAQGIHAGISPPRFTRVKKRPRTTTCCCLHPASRDHENRNQKMRPSEPDRDRWDAKTLP